MVRATLLNLQGLCAVGKVRRVASRPSWHLWEEAALCEYLEYGV